VPRGAGLTRVTIVEDHELFAEALDMAITLQGHEVRRVSAGDPDQSSANLLKQVKRQRPQIVLLDLDLGLTGDGVALVEPLARGGIAVIVVSASVETPRLGECVRLGARAIVSKSEPLNVIIGKIRCVASGLPALPRDEREQLLTSYHQEHRVVREIRAGLASLSRRESEVLGELMTGATVTDIARSWYVSDATVRTQVKSIRTKLGVSSQLAAVGAAIRAHWQPPPRPQAS
jgi:DNA-binding NarL/FixJ family response regulator